MDSLTTGDIVQCEGRGELSGCLEFSAKIADVSRDGLTVACSVFPLPTVMYFPLLLLFKVADVGGAEVAEHKLFVPRVAAHHRALAAEPPDPQSPKLSISTLAPVIFSQKYSDGMIILNVDNITMSLTDRVDYSMSGVDQIFPAVSVCVVQSLTCGPLIHG